MGIHSRIDEMWKQCYQRARVGNNYVNRNQIGAIVGVQPFGGQGLSGTGPKAGGPLYLHRFVSDCPVNGSDGSAAPAARGNGATGIDEQCVSAAGLRHAVEKLGKNGTEWPDGPEARSVVLERAAEAFESGPKSLRGVDAAGDGEARRGGDYLRVYAAQVESEFASPMQLAGPTGERNELSFWPKGTVACIALDSESGIGALIAQTGAALAAGNTAILWHPEAGAAEAVARVLHKAGVPDWVVQAVAPGTDAALSALVGTAELDMVAFAGDGQTAREASAVLAGTDGPLRQLVLFRETPEASDDAVGQGQPVASSPHYLHRFVHERSLSIDTTASGGNASLLSIEDGPGLPGEN